MDGAVRLLGEATEELPLAHRRSGELGVRRRVLQGEGGAHARDEQKQAKQK